MSETQKDRQTGKQRKRERGPRKEPLESWNNNVKVRRQVVLRKLFSLKKFHKLLFLSVNFNSQK